MKTSMPKAGILLSNSGVVDREITLALKDYEKGRFIGPFETAKAATDALHRHVLDYDGYRKRKIAKGESGRE